MYNVLMFSFVVIMICTAIGCVYVICIASMLTYDLIKEFIEGKRGE